MKTIPVSFLVAGMLLPAVCVAQPPPAADAPPPRGDGARREPLQAFIEAWKNADVDHDGFISSSEFGGMPRIQNIPEEKRAIIFKRLDKDGDGMLSRDELMHFNRQYDGQPKKRLWELDLDKSGGISLTEFRQGDFFKKLPPEKAAEVFQRLDTDGDGLITPKDKPEQPFKRPEGKPGKRPDGDGPGDGRESRHPEKMIQKLDANADGSLSFDEYRTGPGTKELTEDQQEDRFEGLDKNGDHRISLEEIHPPSPRPGEEKN